MKRLIFICLAPAILCSTSRAQSFLARRDYYALALGGQNLAVFDATGDGIPDLIYNEGNTIEVRSGEGNGTFLPSIDTNLPGNYSIAPIGYADLNHDGKIDLIGAARQITPASSGLGVMLGQGNGMFGPLAFYPAGLDSASGKALLADVNGDGKLDAVLPAELYWIPPQFASANACALSEYFGALSPPQNCGTCSS
jgi:FG-GAP-like repeat